MTEEQIELAKRAVACKGWRWVPGMLTTEGMRVVVPCFGDDNEPDDAIPDLTDPASLGCLLALVREAHHEPALYVRWNAVSGRWEVVSRYRLHNDAKTEVESLVAALEDAP